MIDILEGILFSNNKKRYEKIQSEVRQFSAEYAGSAIIRDNIFAVMANYARKKQINLELLKFPVSDKELWAFTFLKQDTIFVSVNTALPFCKQFFAAAHELYHIYCYVEKEDESYKKNGSMLDSSLSEGQREKMEDMEANAFAGLLLMPTLILREQIALYGLEKETASLDVVLMLMEMFAMPYKVVVLRLYESEIISRHQAEKLLSVSPDEVNRRIMITGNAMHWQLDGKGTESFGSLLENVEYNSEHDYLTQSRENEDRDYISRLKKEFGLE